MKFIIEGEEEIGSPNLEKYIEANKDKLAADVIVISDTGMQGPGHPAVCYGLRGLCGVQIDVQGAKSDLHSGLYGGGVQNPIHALAKYSHRSVIKKERLQLKDFTTMSVLY